MMFLSELSLNPNNGETICTLLIESHKNVHVKLLNMWQLTKERRKLNDLRFFAAI